MENPSGRESKIGKGVHRYPGHDDRTAGIYSAAEPVRGFWLEELTHVCTHARTHGLPSRARHRRLPDERNKIAILEFHRYRSCVTFGICKVL